MDLIYSAEDEAFRTEICGAGCESNLPNGWWTSIPAFEMTAEDRKAFNEAWPAKLFEGGWICATWPKEYGGKGLTTMQGVVLAEEFARAKAPMRGDFFGDTLVGPTMLQWGTEEQKKEFLPKILSGQMRWCQGFSEPNSGSDLASLKTTAVLDGDEWVINGQKVWTTQGHHADYCFLLTRTDPDAPKHKGISYLLVPMRQPGVEVRGIVQPDGTAEFCEVFFTDARCPKDNVVGGVNNGWKVANSTLAFERGHERHHRVPALRGGVQADGRAGAGENGTIDDPPIRQRLCDVLHEDPDPADQRPALAVEHARRHEGPERRRARARPNKMFWSEMHKAAMELALDICGADVDARRHRSAEPVRGRAPPATRVAPGYPVSPMMSCVLLQPQRDDLGRHQPDPAQHRRRARPRPPQGAPNRPDPET